MVDATLSLTILGSGSSGGVPRIGNDWGACDPKDSRNRRRRCAVLFERHSATTNSSTTVLVDTPPDLREQMLDANVQRLDAVLFTHAHADQCHGIDDLRVFAIRDRAQVDVYMDQETGATLESRFDYCFRQKPGSPYPPILKRHEYLEPGNLRVIEGEGGRMPVLPLRLDHGSPMNSLGFRVQSIAYVNDVVRIPESSIKALRGLDVLVVDALRYAPHPTHANVNQALEWIDMLQPRRAILTNLHVDLDYRELSERLPDSVEPAYDGLKVTVPA